MPRPPGSAFQILFKFVGSLALLLFSLLLLLLLLLRLFRSRFLRLRRLTGRQMHWSKDLPEVLKAIRDEQERLAEQEQVDRPQGDNNQRPSKVQSPRLRSTRAELASQDSVYVHCKFF
eukprot:SAG22_NODE_1093_length_5587_cov_2.485334_3_plen_118_part_00